MHPDSNAAATRILLWDLPLRIFHWSLVLAVTTAIVSAKIGGEWMELHGKAGLAIIGLLVFRVTWGIVGSTHARFSNFAPTPAKIRNYLKGKWQGIGHNPLGALSVFALLGLLAAQATTGLFSNDDISFNGPLYVLVEQNVSDRLTGWHHQLSNVLFVLLGLHLIAVFFYVIIKRNNLIKPMLTGWKTVQSPNTQKPLKPVKQGSLPALVASITIAVLVVYGASSAGAVGKIVASATPAVVVAATSTTTTHQSPAR
jgi:cytochrome b